MESYLGTKLVIIITFAFWLISSTSLYFFYLVVLHLGYDFTDNLDQLWQLRYFGLGITSASLLLSFLAALLLSRWLGHPLGKLQEAVEKVRAGELNTFIEINRQDQLGFLVETFNSMVAAVQEQAQSIVLSSELIEYYKLKNKYSKATIYPIELQEITNSALENFYNLFEKEKLQLINAIPLDIPVVEADKTFLRQILHDLINSAIKFTDVSVIKVSAEVVEHQLEITVADISTAMKAEQLEEMFGNEQADDLRVKEFSSTSLDFALTKQLVNLQGGQLYCSSTVRQGLQFTFTLPILQNIPLVNLTSLPYAPQTKTMTTSGASTASRGKFTILVVDDDKTNLQVLTKLLTPHHYEVLQASSGMQALEEMAKGLEPDLIILDIMMPQMDGYEVCQKIRQSFPPNQLPIIMLTAKDQPSDLVEGLSRGANDYLVKPINRSELLARVKTHIQLAKVNTAYSRFVPNEFIRLLGHESILDVKLGDHVKKEMAILFSDIRSFTTLSEQMSPEENFAFINSYLKMVVPAIRNHNGFIDKYIGDAVMAVFHQQAEDALLAAIEMQKQVLHYNCDRVADGKVPIAIGTGIHVGS